MLGLLRRYMMMVLQKQLNEEKNNLEVQDASFEHYMISELTRLESSRVIQSEEDLNHWMGDQHVQDIILRLNPYLKE